MGQVQSVTMQPHTSPIGEVMGQVLSGLIIAVMGQIQLVTIQPHTSLTGGIMGQVHSGLLGGAVLS
jgi:hypothetical protein